MAGKLLITTDNRCSLLPNNGIVDVYANYAPLIEPLQLNRWKVYGVPYEPNPEYQRLNKALAVWSRAKNVGTVTAGKVSQGRLNNVRIIRESKRSLVALQQTDNALIERLPRSPMRQQEVKQQLLWKPTQDEAHAIQFLAEESNISLVAATIYKKWQLDRQLIK